MKKTLIASAIAAISFSGVAAAQNTADVSASKLAARMDSMPQVYGNIQYAGVYSDVKDGEHGLVHRDNGSTLGVKHDHELAPGITGFFKLELEGINADNKSDSNGIDALDEAYIGVRGDSFGQLWLGSDDSTYERAVDVIDQYYEAADLTLDVPYSTGEGDLVQYMSPSFGGLSLWAAVQVNGDDEITTRQVVDPATLEVTEEEINADDKSYPWQLAAVYSVDMFELAAAIDSNDNGTDNNENTYGVRGTVNLDALSLTAEYHTRKDVEDKYGLMGIYTVGANRFALSYEMLEEDDASEDTTDTITLQALHNLSDHMYVYVEGYLGGGDDVYDTGMTDATGNTIYSDERSVAAVGAVYYF